MNTRGILMKQIVMLIIGVIAFAILASLFGSVFSPNFDRLDKGSERYFDTLLSQIAIADGGGEGEFRLWHPEGDEDVDFFLVYFGGEYIFITKDGNRKFFAEGKLDSNRLCVCYWDGKKGVCDYCEELEYPIYFNGEYEPWIIATGESVSINKGEEQYEFAKF